MLSQTAEYALRAVLHLAREGGRGPVRVDDIAAALDVPRNYLSKILHVLARAGILESTRGPHGGFELAHPAGDLTLADVVEEFDPLKESASCLLGRRRCDDRTPCSAHARWKEVAETVRSFFRETTVAELAGIPGQEALELPVA
ncbi:MAG TPA: RrF2 family transcriptional regulator [Longimicrobiales bacterium]|nr:RrF2 family transcriptional regulator [Longimicrobiales bacterium]